MQHLNTSSRQPHKFHDPVLKTFFSFSIKLLLIITISCVLVLLTTKRAAAVPVLKNTGDQVISKIKGQSRI